jgi:hypothetical protein
MATAPGTVLVLTAGGITFFNEWYQNHEINWKVPIATLLAGAVIDGLAHWNNRAATGLGVIVLIGAVVTRFNGKSIADVLDEAFTKKKHPPQTAARQQATTPKVQVA